MKKFTYLLMAALFCGSFTAFAQDDEVKVTPATTEDGDPAFTFQKDYKYYGIYLDEETKSANLSDDQYVYIGPDADNGRNLWMWNGFDFPTTSNVNSFGIPGGYTSVQVTGKDGWSGLGYNIAAANPVDLSGITSDYTFHIALNSKGKDSFDFYLTDGKGKEAHLVFGDAAFGDNDPVANFNRDGEWYNIDIPMSYLEDNFGFSFKGADKYADKNILCLLAGGNAGFTIDYDAVFFYGPKNSATGIKDITTTTQNGAAEYYTVDGKKVSEAQAKAIKGIYIMKQNGAAKKIVNQ